MFVIGGSVAGGLYGNHPLIDPNALDAEGNTPYTQNGSNGGYESTDFRDVYGTILRHWMGVDPFTALTLEAGDPNVNWTAANFDLPLFVP
jgi:uncharacterized protein (DUF1501 family)